MTLPKYITAKQLAGKPGMPKTESAVIRRAKREGWQSRKRSGQGGGLEYLITDLPQETQSALLDAMIEQIPETCCALPALKENNALALAEELPAPASLPAWRRNTMDARLQILALIDQLAQSTSLNKAIDRVVAQAKNELLPEHIQALIPLANARSGKEGKRTLSRRTLFRWRELRAIGTTALAPAEQEKRPIPAWAPYFLKCYQKPQKPSVPMALEELEVTIPQQIALPSESQARRFLAKMSKVEREKGRRSAKEMRALKPFRRRDTSEMMPLDVCQCDGHSFKARIAHPVHGKPFHPEVCAVEDAATRMVIGWSAGLAESAETVADALRHGITVGPGNERGGIPAIFYTDPGSGNKAKVNADPAFGRYARLGITFKTGIVGNSQARGLVERLQQSLWIRAAKQLQTFTGKDMDGSVEHKTYKLLMSDVRGKTNSGTLPSWPQFLDLCQQAVERYNNRPHSSLPKITDASGKRRYMTPVEMWDTHIAQGWVPESASPAEIDDLFRPRVQVTTRRGEVRLFGNIYFNSELKHHLDEQVFVEYEPQNGQFVNVRDMDERLICRAEFEHNKSRMFAVSAQEAANEKRAAGRKKRLTVQLEEVEQERRGLVDVVRDGQPLILDNPEEQAAELQAARQRIAQAEQVEQSPAEEPEETPQQRYARWQRVDKAMQAGEPVSQENIYWHGTYQKHTEFSTQKMMAEDFADFYKAAASDKEQEETHDR